MAILLRQSSARPQCPPEFEAAAGGVERIAELLPSGMLEMSGDPFRGLRFPNLFRLPAARS
ncbi:MAG TPA: hypothetical protein VNR66_07255 [Solirubrobacteraceae bacterium]|nr:hypothetical protein [Solirubrobacteraceae bacterium]